jgi:CheY-like chemotaxis protein
MAKIMLVEDDATMVTLLTTLLKMDGFEVLPLDPDQDVPAAVKRGDPDVLLLDVHLSNQDGLRILDTLRQSDDTRHTYVIMISGMNVREECMRRGADAFLLKPFMPDDLMNLLKQARHVP